MIQTAVQRSEFPDLSTEYALSAEQITAFQQTGHTYLKSVCTPVEIAAYRPILNQAAERFNTEKRSLEERDTYGKAFLQIMNLWEQDEQVRRFTLARRFAQIAANLLGVDGVRLYHDQALFKEPGGGPTPWHQDQSYWPLDTKKTVTMWMPLVPILPEIGSMTFASRSHLQGDLRPVRDDAPISDDSERDFNHLVEEREFARVHYGAMQAGDATFHTGWTLHCAPGNPTSTMREVMTIIYFADGTHATEPQSKFQRDDIARWLPDVKPGDLAASVLNPVVYTRL